MTGLRGADKLIRNLKDLSKQFPDRVKAALYVEAQILMTEAKRRCPVAPDGGVLRASGIAHEPVREGRKITAEMTFGGAAQDYAIAVHEHLSEHSPYSWVVAELTGPGVQWNANGTGPKFLEGPINEVQPHLAANIAARVHLEHH